MLCAIFGRRQMSQLEVLGSALKAEISASICVENQAGSLACRNFTAPSIWAQHAQSFMEEAASCLEESCIGETVGL